MAAVAATDVTRISGYELGDRYGRRIEDVKVFDVVFSSNGGTADDVPASLFGFTTINWVMCVRSLVSTTLANVVPVVEADGAGLLLCDPENATDASRGNPTNYTGTVRLRMGGV